MNLHPRIRKAIAWLMLASSFGWVVEPARAALDIAETPLFLKIPVAPNVVVTLDDSGSMARAYSPDLCGGSGYVCDLLHDNRWTKSAYANPIYYDPAITYLPPLKADGTELSTSFAAAYINGFDPAWGTPVNLASEYRPTARLHFPNAVDRLHEYMEHYPGESDLKINAVPNAHDDVGTMIGTNSGSNAPYFIISDFDNYDGTASGSNPGSNLISVKVNGTAASNVGTFTGTCSNSNDPGNTNEYFTKISGSTLTLCFRDANAMYGKSVEIVHKKAGSTAGASAGPTDPAPAYYYVFDSANVNCDGTKTDNDCYDLVIVGAASGPGGVDERQNFANWYSFYRTRGLATMASASRAFFDFDPTTRLAWQALGSCRGSSTSLVTTDCEGWETTTTNFSNAIKPFTGTHKENFYKWLFRQKTGSATPLKAATIRAGEYFSTTGENSPYDDELNVAGSVIGSAGQTGSAGQLSCRKNFHILMTDGVWNESTTTSTAVGTADDALAAPYKGATSNTLADIAYHYWATDLTSLDNNITPYMPAKETNPDLANANPRNDPAEHQHMVNFMVGLGLESFLVESGLTWGGDTYSGSFDAINGGTLNWPVPSSNHENNVSDLWHAAINSRGQFFSADNTQSLINAFAAVQEAIEDAEPSAAALAANSTSIEDGAFVYQATFNGSDWSGDLKAFFIDSFGNVSSTSTWEASTKMPAPDDRKIYTRLAGGEKVDFEWSSLPDPSAERSYLNTNASGTADALGSDRLNWLRGVQTQEVKNGGTFRNRSSILGDIINSDPAYAHQEDLGYATMGADEASTYADYVLEKGARKAVVFVGANDGMLHAFLAETGTDAGKELFAYVPNGVYANLSKLTSPNYSHKYYVDAGPTVGDVYFGSDWHTVLVGGLGGGGKSIYALNVSNVDSPSATSIVLWEYTDTDLGLTYSKPQIVRLNDGNWAAVFGNGFNSASEKAYLYIVDIGTGGLIKKIAVGPSVPANGLSTPVLYDATDDKIMDYVYVGDLQGNLWKIDLSSDDTDDWGVAYSGAPLFTARNAAGEVQPIHAQPVVGSEPVTSDPAGVMVYFGTGQYLESDDVKDATVQSFYGIWDKGTAIATTNRSELQQQTITDATSEFGLELRETSNNSVDWVYRRGWYMDFNTSSGERVVTQALLRYDRVIFLTLVPSTEVCSPSGESWLMELDALTGSRTLVSSFDFSGPEGGSDGKFDDSDLLASGATVSGVKTSVGITKTAAWFTGGDGKDFKVMTGTSGGIESIGNKGGPGGPPGGGGTLRRTYWLQIQ